MSAAMPTDTPHARTLRNVDRWGPVTQLLHWLIVIGILTMAILGLTMTELPGEYTITGTVLMVPRLFFIEKNIK